MSNVCAYRKVAAGDRAPGEDAFWYISKGHLCCPRCGDSLCHDDASPKAGTYYTQDGEQVTYPPEPGDNDEIKAYHQACYHLKQAEQQAENADMVVGGSR